MIKRVHWTTEAHRTFTINREYLSKEWEHEVTSKFLDRIDEIVQKIKVNPRMFARHMEQNNVHKCVVHERIVLYYKIVDDDQIDLLSFWNTYQDPEMLKL